MNKYRSQDEDVIVENPAAGEGEAIVAVPTAEPDMPPATPVEPVNDVESTRAPEADPTVPEQHFRFFSEDINAEDGNAPAEGAVPPPAPAAPMDAPAEAPAADTTPANAPAETTPATPAEGAVPPPAPAAPMDAPVADVPAAAPMTEQPETDIAPATDTTDGAVPPPAPVAPNAENVLPNEAGTNGVGAVEPNGATPPSEATPPADDNAGNNGASMRFRQDGEEIIVVNTPEPRTPPETETAECPETGDEYVDKNVKEPINPVIEQSDDLAEDVGTEAPAPAEEPTHDDETIITPDEPAEDAADAEDPLPLTTDGSAVDEEVAFTEYMRMEDDSETNSETETGDQPGDQDVNATVNVSVRKDDGDSHAEDSADAGADVSDNGDQTPEQRFNYRQDGDKLPPPPDSIEIGDKVTRDNNEKKYTGPVPEDKSPSRFVTSEDQVETVADIVPVPNPNTGAPKPSGDPDLINPASGNEGVNQMFGQWMQEGGDWL